MKVNVPAGYNLVNAFNGTDTKVELLRDANGEYYLVVPRGGAVTLSVTLEVIPDEPRQQTQTVTRAAAQETTTMNDEQIASAVEQLLTRDGLSEDTTVEVQTAEDGKKTVVIAPTTTDVEETATLTMTVPQETLAESEVEQISAPFAFPSQFAGYPSAIYSPCVAKSLTICRQISTLWSISSATACS